MKFQVGDIVSDQLIGQRQAKWLIVEHKPDNQRRDEGEYYMLHLAKNVYSYRDVSFVDMFYILEV